MTAMELIFQAVQNAIINIAGDMTTAILGLLSIILIVAGLKWLLGLFLGVVDERTEKRLEGEAEWWYEASEKSEGFRKELNTMRFRNRMRRLSKYDD